MPVAQFTIGTGMPEILTEIDPDFLGDVVSNVIKFDTSFTICEFKETICGLSHSAVGIIDKYPFRFS